MVGKVRRGGLLWPLRICAAVSVLAGVLFVMSAIPPQLSPAPPTMDVLLLTAIGGTAVTIVLLILWVRHWTGLLLLLLLPPLIVPLSYGALMIPATDTARLRLADGRVVHLSVGPTLTDLTYDLWQEEQGGWLWRRTMADLSYSEDGRFINEERLALSSDGRRLLVGRGGIWTDCVEVRDYQPCALGIADTNWSDPDFETRMRGNSAVIGATLK
ncbi:hypothetical protein [Caulobacter sp. DWR2-3-1b2]|uniref:hypothetical protein n=1 Tax=Caulobacter sp. DWR2-3-1b2 TaxID=2804642 RepID=UPI003CF9F10D